MHLQLQMKGQKHLHQHLLIKQMFTIERLQVLLKKVRQQFLIKKKQIEQKRWLIDHINKRPGSNFVRSVLKAKPCKIKGCWKDYCVLVGISVKIRGMQIGSISNVQRPYKHRTLPTFYCCCTGAKSRAKQRIMQDLKRIQRSPPPGISAGPVSEHNIMKWDAIILGPKNTIYEGGAYKLSITFTDMYPNQPPTFKFKQKIFHPNIDLNSGAICMDILGSKWRPVLDIAIVLTTIQALLSDPNVDSPMNSEAAQLYKKNRIQYMARVRESNQNFW
eukprot:TRINITY_DN2137_c0_g1_i1.p1 TRINITY_DN2137_c0_g1~~TRINITY_DN2137_c0_g1_i1.p1  ORF type:complete len:274 (+),score=11.06 TRINITY_DN2137_c0_g1_i1:1-822(+)